MKNESVKVHFYNPICSFKYCICLALDKDRCKPIEADNLADWTVQAKKRANYCNYRGLELTANEVITREMNIKKANKCSYLMR